MFKPGDVVRLADGRVAVIVLIGDYSGDDRPLYELHVAADDGIGIVEPWEVAPSNDEHSIAEARRLGLRGLRS